MKNELEMKADQIAQVAPASENTQPHKLIYLAPSIWEYSYLVEAGYATSVKPGPEDFGNGWNGGGGDLGGGDPEDPTNPFSDPTDPLNPISF